MSERRGSSAEAIDGVIPATVVEPDSVEELTAALERAARDQLLVVPRGGGTKLSWGPPPSRIDILLSTARLDRVLAHRHGDLTATVQAGATLAAANEQLGAHRQWIPLDPPASGRATIGGIVATNDSGPRRHRYGAPRDLIIGVELARADGRLARGGGIVVKNVAGYDLPRLMSGSFGSLGVIVSATFKLYPMSPASRTLLVPLREGRDAATLSNLIAQLLASPLTPTAVEIATRPLRLLMRFESIETVVEQQAAAAAALVAGLGLRSDSLSGAEEQRLWAEHQDAASNEQGALLKITLLPAELGAVLGALEDLLGSGHYALTGRAGVGVLLVQIGGNAAAHSAAIRGLRKELPPARGSVVIVRGSRELRESEGVWGELGDGAGLMRAVKQQFDPAGVLRQVF